MLDAGPGALLVPRELAFVTTAPSSAVVVRLEGQDSRAPASPWRVLLNTRSPPSIAHRRSLLVVAGDPVRRLRVSFSPPDVDRSQVRLYADCPQPLRLPLASPPVSLRQLAPGYVQLAPSYQPLRSSGRLLVACLDGPKAPPEVHASLADPADPTLRLPCLLANPALLLTHRGQCGVVCGTLVPLEPGQQDSSSVSAAAAASSALATSYVEVTAFYPLQPPPPTPPLESSAALSPSQLSKAGRRAWRTLIKGVGLAIRGRLLALGPVMHAKGKRDWAVLSKTQNQERMLPTQATSDSAGKSFFFLELADAEPAAGGDAVSVRLVFYSASIAVHPVGV